MTCRRFHSHACAIALAFAAFVPFAIAAEPSTPVQSAATSAPLTPEAVRELVARLSDAEVRKLLIEHLDKSTGVAPAPAPDSTAGMLDRMDHGATMARSHFADLRSGLDGLPEALRTMLAQLATQAGSDGHVAWMGFLFAMLVAGLVTELIWRRASAHWRTTLQTPAHHGPTAAIVALALRALAETAHVAVFAVAGALLYVIAWHGGPLTRITLLGLFGTIALARLVYALSDFLLAPRRPLARLLPLDDAAGTALLRGTSALTAIVGLNYTLARLLRVSGASTATIDVATILPPMVAVIVCMVVIWRIRVAIATHIRSAGGGGPIASWAADLWPAAAVLYVLGVFAGRVGETMTGHAQGGEGVASLVILVALPVVDYALSRALALVIEPTGATPATNWHALAHAYEPVLRRVIHIVVVVVGFLLLAQVWELNLFAMAERGLGGRIASSLIGIGIVVLLAYVVWDIARTAIDRRLSAEGVNADGAPTSRLRTLLPLLRVSLALAIVVMAAMSILAALGVDILPLLAGAGVVGVAVGFGSQTLVRDIVSGAFFLMDDAFRLGEYIEVGDAKGRIEKITLRSLFLRHHRGALNVLPYGEIKRLRNTSRDWTVMVLEFKLALDTDLKKVKGLVKTIAEEIGADPELGPHLIAPLKSQGVLATDDSSLTVRVKYTARPGDGPFMIQRVAYEKILKAFSANHIEFAGKRVEVHVASDVTDRHRVAGAAALPAIEVAPIAKDP